MERKRSERVLVDMWTFVQCAPCAAPMYVRTPSARESAVLENQLITEHSNGLVELAWQCNVAGFEKKLNRTNKSNTFDAFHASERAAARVEATFAAEWHDVDFKRRHSRVEPWIRTPLERGVVVRDRL